MIISVHSVIGSPELSSAENVRIPLFDESDGTKWGELEIPT